jgi:uncharacterized protein involved in exopolysaccharide biosynthesis
VVFGLAVVLALTLPPAYRSTATIMIEAGYPRPGALHRHHLCYQRIELISRQVMTQPNLQRIIEKFNVYPSLRQEGALPEAVERLQLNITVEPISANVVDPKTQRSGTATIAFTLSYNGETPELAQQVTDELTSLFLKDNVKMRTETAAVTSEFLAEAARLRGQIAELEARIATFKGRIATCCRSWASSLCRC